TIPSPVSEAISFLSGWANLWLLGAVLGSVFFLVLFSGSLHKIKSDYKQKVLV
ncbi:hypothetical protein N325_07450, partial [Colius striatus]